MIFSLEALRARHGDALLLHCGPNDDPDLYVIDGGWFGVYADSLRPRLEQLRGQQEELPIRLLMISHVDQDHIIGVLNMTKELRERKQAQEPLPYKIRTIWHNAFDDISDNGAKVLQEAGAASVATASAAEAAALPIPVKEEAAIRLAGINDGRTLRDDAKLLNLEINKHGEDGLVQASPDALEGPFSEGVDIHVVGPGPDQIEKFRQKWDQYLRDKEISPREAGVELAEFLDSSAANLASIVALVRCGGKEILFTGDARGDFVLEGLTSANLLDAAGKRRLDVLKVPHHGSNRNVTADFFASLPADHYVISGDGEHGNPDVDTFEMIFDGREADGGSFTFHLTYDPAEYRPDSKHDTPYPLAKLNALLQRKRDEGREFEVRFPKADSLGLRLDLLDPPASPEP